MCFKQSRLTQKQILKLKPRAEGFASDLVPGNRRKEVEKVRLERKGAVVG